MRPEDMLALNNHGVSSRSSIQRCAGQSTSQGDGVTQCTQSTESAPAPVSTKPVGTTTSEVEAVISGTTKE